VSLKKIAKFREREGEGASSSSRRRQRGLLKVRAAWRLPSGGCKANIVRRPPRRRARSAPRPRVPRHVTPHSSTGLSSPFSRDGPSFAAEIGLRSLRWSRLLWPCLLVTISLPSVVVLVSSMVCYPTFWAQSENKVSDFSFHP
jgi:predicted nucleic acid-binding Zn ribbon protein